MKKITTLLGGVLLCMASFAQISVFPSYTDFEAEGLCGTSCTGACNLTGVWRNADQWAFPQAGTDWLAENGPTPSAATGPDVDHTFGTAVAKYAYVETSGCNNTTAHLVSDICNFSAQSSPRISFWWHMYGATMGTMHLDIDTTGLGNWVLDVVPSWTANVNTWQFSDYSIAQLGGRPSTRIRFRMQTGTSFTSDAALDDITIYQPQPNDVTMASVLVGGGCGNSVCTPVQIEIVNSGSDTINAGTQFPVSFEVNAVVVTETYTAPVNILPGDTVTYTFTGCVDLSGPSSVTVDAWSAWSLDVTPANDSATTTTIGIPIISTYPYMQDFETGQNGWVINNGAAGTWAFGTPAKTTIVGASSGVNAFVTGGLGTGFYNNTDNSWVDGPCFDFTNLCDPVISLRVWWNAEFSWDGMNVLTSIDGGTTWQLQGNYLDQMNWYTDNTVAGAPGGYQEAWSGRASTANGSGGWVTARHHLSGVAGQSNVKIRIAFGTDGSVVDDGCAFDDILITDGVYLGADQLVCSPATSTLSADFGYPLGVTYAWSTGATTSSITASATGWYWVDVTNGACTNRDSIYLVSVDANSDVMLGPDTTICGVPGMMLDAGYWPTASYLWSDNSTGQTLGAFMSGTYYVEVTTACGVMRDTIVVTIDPADVDLGPPLNECAATTLDAGTGFASYLWNTGDTTQAIVAATSGTYYVDATTSTGCVVTDTIAVVINTPPTVTIAGPPMGICLGDTTMLMAMGAGVYQWVNGPFGDMYMVAPTVDTTYWVVGLDTLTGCTDSASIMVTVNQPVTFTQSPTVCYGGSITVGSNTYTTSGTYMDTLATAMGCDSIVTTNLTVDTLLWSSQSYTICQGNSVTVGSNTYNQSGTYSDTLVGSNGCDSLVTTNLTVNPALTFSQSLTICSGQSVVVGSNTYTSSGTYVDTLTNGNGCDSIVTTQLTVNTVNVGVTVTGNGATLTANNAAATSYQWINCANMQPIAGATSSSYTATANGSYAVIITDGSCTDTSACTPVTNIGIDDPTVDYMFNVFPNPTYGNVTIATSKPTQVVIFNALGETVMAQQVQNTVTLDLTALEGGVYFIRTTEGKVVRLVKE